MVQQAYEAMNLEAPLDFREALSLVDIGELEQTYMRLFIGPAELPVLPWESAIVSDERILFQKNTLEVRRAYKAAGFVPSFGESVADDHIALELGFLSSLAYRALQAYRRNDIDEQMRTLDRSIAFLNKHLSQWANKYAELLFLEQDAEVYGLAALSMSSFISYDIELLETVVEMA